MSQVRRSRKGREPTIIDIARASGVSKTTVSRVLNGASNVAPETRARVLEAVRTFDYRVNAAARSLRTARSLLVGLLVPAIGNDVFGRVAEVLEEELRRHGVGVLIASSGWDAQGEAVALESLRARRVDGFVLSLVDDRRPTIADELSSLGRPLVLIDREVRGVVADVVLTDMHGGIADGLRHLAGLGHRAIGVTSISLSVRPGREVAAAVDWARQELGLRDVEHIVVPYERIDRRSGHEIADRLSAIGATAIVSCVPTPITAGVLERFVELGVRVPEDMSVVGFDDSELAAVVRPGLTVITRQLDELSRAASRQIISRLIDPQLRPRVESVHMQLVVRGSTAAPARRRAGEGVGALGAVG